MAWDIVTRIFKPVLPRSPAVPGKGRKTLSLVLQNRLHGAEDRRGSVGLAPRILGVNIIPILILGFSILYLDQYKESLVQAELETLKAQAQLFAGAIAEGAVRPSVSTEALIFQEPEEAEALISELSRRMVRRLSETTDARTRLFDSAGQLVGDSHQLMGPGGVVQIMPLEAPQTEFTLNKFARNITGFFTSFLPQNITLPAYPVISSGNAEDYPDASAALEGNIAASAWRNNDRSITLSAAVPVQKIKQVLGVVLLTRDGEKIEQAIASVRMDILRVFFGTLSITVLLSLYLSGVIARPLKKLAVAAESVRMDKGRNTQIPDLSNRRDEIGELSIALREMTTALWNRMDTIERFAADVAHEIKNPLTSLRSAVETAARIKDPEKQSKLMDIVMHDVQRLDRLISDISGASRLDAELSRETLVPVDLSGILTQLLDAFREPLERADQNKDKTNVGIDEHNVVLDLPEDTPLDVYGNQSRLAQVFRNLINNALSFSPHDGIVTIRAERSRRKVTVHIEDQGPGIPENKLESIFDRFYTERPEHEQYGKHSGLGLSIAKQIVENHGGEIFAVNMMDNNGTVKGARFTVVLNAAD
jgi:two-component system sensor histidine kinase ChvG